MAGVGVAPSVVARPPVASFTRNLWADTFTSFTFDHQVQLKYAMAIEALKDEVRSMLIQSTDKGKERLGEKLVLIDTLERLGIGYHFQQEIEHLLQQIFHSTEEDEEDDVDDLFITSLRFRLLRQHHHYVSCSVFDKFKVDGDSNKFKETVCGDAKGLLSLYEAAHLRTHGEQILEEALAFTTHHLKRLLLLGQQLIECPPSLQDQVKRALEQPLHTGVPRIEHRYYISSYEKDESRNDILLKLAKLDFNYVQNMHKSELHQLSRWWNELDLKSKLSHTRDILVEIYLWANTFHYEPQYSDARVACTKSYLMLGVVDDTYDNYATVEEADLFTEVLERWNIDEIDRLPDYMKPIYKFILGLYEDYGHKAVEQGKPFASPYAIESVKQICRAYNKELQWFSGALPMPTYDDYLANSKYTSGLYIASAAIVPGMKSVTEEIMQWLMGTDAEIVTASAKLVRCVNDIASHQRESKLGQTWTGVDIHMNHHGLSLQESNEKIVELVECLWKDMNACWMDKASNCDVPKDVLEHVLNFARLAVVTYKNREDGLVTPEKVIADPIRAVFVDPIII